MAVPQLPGSFVPPPARYSSAISSDPSSEFPAEPGRYALYIHLGCPFAHRDNIAYHIKHLHSIVALSVVSIHRDESSSWTYDGTGGSDPTDPVEGFKNMKELYLKADPETKEYPSIPLIWDRKKKTIVNNDSEQIVKILSSAFDAFLSPELREINKPGGGLRPENLTKQIDKLNAEIDLEISWGTYKCGFAATQADYNESMKRLFGKLDEMDERLGHRKYLHGNHITESDILLFTTCVRFDMAYYTILNCDLKQIRYDYPNIHRWLRELYYEVDEEAKGAFKSTTHFEIFMEGYALSAMRLKIVPWGPAIPIMPLDA